MLIAGADGSWKGSGRSVAAFDLHAALGACAADLERFGGHRAAAGLSISPDRVDAFAAAFAAYADATLSDDDLAPSTRVDAIVPGSKLTLGLCAELGATRAVRARESGRDAARRRVRARRPRKRSATGSTFASGCASAGATPARRSRSGWAGSSTGFRRPGRYDVAFRLQENRWNGVTSPQLVVRRVFDADDRYDELREWLAAEWRAGEAAWTPEARAIFAELELTEAGIRRSLLESQSFRALLETPPSVADAA